MIVFLPSPFQVFQAAQHGFPRATGIEINRVLVYYARLKSYLTGQRKICQFKRANLWKVILRKFPFFSHFVFFLSMIYQNMIPLFYSVLIQW